MSRYIGFFALALIVVVALVTTFLTFRQKPSDVVVVDLGIRPSTSPHVKAIELASVSAFERGQFSKELSQRLSKPTKRVALERFLVDQCEVSQLEWEQFVEWSRSQPDYIEDENADWLVSKSTGHRVAGRLDSPASGINFQEASTYCEESGGRLPYAEEFEAMASGSQGRIYPWGDEFNAQAWPYNSSARNASQSCGLHPDTTTPTGIHDLAANAMEWSQGPMNQDSESDQAALHGAPAARQSNRSLYALNAAWLPMDPKLKSHYVGFRCVYDQPPLPSPWRTTAMRLVGIAGGEFSVGLPQDARLPLFLANMPPVSGVQLKQLLASEESGMQHLTVERCEVKRQTYQSFLSDPLVRLGMYSNENEPEGVSYEPLFWQEQLESPTLPVFGVHWWAADAYARWVGGRLPTVDEWRQIAAGRRGSSYPWGMEYDSDAANIGDTESGQLSSCGSAERDVVSGVADLGGNLSEWTRSIGMSHSRLTMWVQGGNWLLPGRETTQTIFGRPVPLTHQSTSIGFRVVYD